MTIQHDGKKKRLIVHVDFNDEVYERKQPITLRETRELVERLAQNGVDTLLYRAGCVGLLPYRTRLGYQPLFFDEADAGKNMEGNPCVKGDYQRKRGEFIGKYNRVIESFNPPEEIIKAGHAVGMQVLVWLDLFDDWFPGHRSKFLDEHPHCQWTARDGKTYYRGIASYAWPEARAFRVAQAKELLALGADGIHCSTSSHARHHPNVHQLDYYGFETPVVDEYRRRHGIDLRTAKEFDREAWHVLKGEFMSKLYEELSALCHGSGKELWIGLQFGEQTFLSANPYHSGNVVARYHNDWRGMVEKGIADAFILGDYEIASNPSFVDSCCDCPSYWKAKGLAHEPDIHAWAAREYQTACRGKTKLFVFGEWLSHDREKTQKLLSDWTRRVTNHDFEGLLVHEALNFEPDKFDLLKNCAAWKIW
ncbi:MAG: hypothetical protein PHV34_18250 [Verrucomicrobiae bacterium]|nr:hypothetical protein [Verrucomicrobiae bacterium]